MMRMASVRVRRAAPYAAPAITQPITPAMLLAGRAAFLRLRSTLDDLTDYYDCDLETFLVGLYTAMDEAGR